jgi:hypothetical protein
MIIRICAILVIGFALWWFFRKLDISKLGEALQTAELWPLFIAAALNFVCLWGKAVCWHIMLAPRFKVGQMRLFRYTIATFAASAISPARAGEVLRIWALKRRENVPAADTAAVAVAEKLLDGITLLVLVAPVPWLVPDLPTWVAGSIALCAGIAVGVFIGLYIAVGRVGVNPPQKSWYRRFIAGMHVLRSPRRLFAALAVLVVVWFADLGEIELVLHAVGVHLPLSGCLLILFTLNLAITVPSTPAQIGALEAGALAALEVLHVPTEQAVAFALLYHALQVVPLIAVGLALEWRLVLGREPQARCTVAEALDDDANKSGECPTRSTAAGGAEEIDKIKNDNAVELPSARSVQR